MRYNHKKRIRVLNDAKDRILTNLKELRWYQLSKIFWSYRILHQLSAMERLEKRGKGYYLCKDKEDVSAMEDSYIKEFQKNSR